MDPVASGVGGVVRGGETVRRDKVSEMMKRTTRFAEQFIWIPYVIVVALMVVAAWWSLDREPPVQILKMIEVTDAAPGEVVHMRIAVRRDTSRQCTVESNRQIIDGDGYKWPLDNVYLTPSQIVADDAASPGETRIAFVVPLGAQPGPATWQTVLHYVCNPIHQVWPIKVEILQPFFIRPTKPGAYWRTDRPAREFLISFEG